jgi:hypothetical protein
MRLVAACQEDGLALTVSDIFERPQLRDVAKSVTIVDDSDHHNAEEDVPPFSLCPWQGSSEAPTEAIKMVALFYGVSPDRIQAARVHRSGPFRCGVEPSSCCSPDPQDKDRRCYKGQWRCGYKGLPSRH